ncbi:MAG: helix-turn-helix domain-containing protein [Minisyncoccia bacterium]
MDEILIEEKKYVSSKRAAKMTGYAKDYVGQLCREGRVPARLVGRSWYVLESAIQDHRFGNPGTDQATPATELPQGNAEKSLQSTWEAPHYEASHAEALPLVHREPVDAPEGQVESSNIRDSWKAWFEHAAVLTSVTAPEEVKAEIVDETPDTLVTSASVEQKAQVVDEEESEKQVEGDSVSVPLHIVDQDLVYKEFLPRRMETQEISRQLDVQKDSGWKTVLIQTAMVLTAIIFLALTSVGSGHFDKYLISSSQASVLTGITIYAK